MEKVPVGRSISHAYEFLFGRIFQIIGTAWLPALLYATACYFFLLNAVTWLAPLTHDSATLTRGIAACAGFALVALVVRAVLGISLTQEALGIRHDILLAHFVVGPRETRLIFAQLRLLVLTLVLYAVTLAVIVLGIGAAIKYGPAVPHVPMVGGKSLLLIGAIIAAVLLDVFFVLTVLKLSFLLNAVASVERHASIRRGWRLARGSGWRILAVLLSVALPVAILAWGAMYFAFGGDMAAVMHAAPGVARMHALLQMYADHALVIAVIAGVAAMVGGALLAGATAAAYRTVTGHEEAEPEDDDALVAPLLVPAHGHSDEPLPPVPDHGHGGHDTHGGHDDHGHGGHEDHGHKDHGHDDSHGHGDGHGHGGHDEAHGHGGGHDTGHGHDDDEDGDDHDEGHGHDDGHGGHGHGHDDHGHGHGHDDHGHKSHDDHHGHDDHGHGNHHAKAA